MKTYEQLLEEARIFTAETTARFAAEAPSAEVQARITDENFGTDRDDQFTYAVGGQVGPFFRTLVRNIKAKDVDFEVRRLAELGNVTRLYGFPEFF